MPGTVRPSPATQAKFEPARYRIRLLDGFEMTTDGPPITLAPTAQRLVAYLAVRHTPCDRRHLADMLFSDHDPIRAAGNLRSMVHRIRKRAPRLLNVQHRQLRIDPTSIIDVRRLDLIIDRLLHPSGIQGAEVPQLSALGAEFLPGWDGDWILVERERLRQRYLHALDAIGTVYLRQGDAIRAIEAAMAAIAVDPLRESPRRILIGSHLLEGNTSEAFREYEQFDQLLQAELGLRPTEQLTALLPDRRRPPPRRRDD